MFLSRSSVVGCGAQSVVKSVYNAQWERCTIGSTSTASMGSMFVAVADVQEYVAHVVNLLVVEN